MYGLGSVGLCWDIRIVVLEAASNPPRRKIRDLKDGWGSIYYYLVIFPQGGEGGLERSSESRGVSPQTEISSSSS